MCQCGDVGTIIQQMAKAWKAFKKRRTNGKAVRAWWKQIEEWRAVNYSPIARTIRL